MVKVVKFGGSSLASAEQFTKVGDIIRSDESRKYVVPSAPGRQSLALAKSPPERAALSAYQRRISE